MDEVMRTGHVGVEHVEYAQVLRNRKCLPRQLGYEASVLTYIGPGYDLYTHTSTRILAKGVSPFLY